MNKEALIAEMNRLLDVGEPLLAVFPTRLPDGWSLKLPDNISPEMRWYAEVVVWRAGDRKDYRHCRQRETTDHLAELVKACKTGLLGWRAIGVLK